MIKIKHVIVPILLGAMFLELGISRDVSAATIEVIERTAVTASVESVGFVDMTPEFDNKGFDVIHSLGFKRKKKKKKRKSKRKAKYVYISTYGKKYHRSRRCSNMKYVSRVTVKYAKQTGRGKCKKCW